MEKHTDWKACCEFLRQAMLVVDPRDDTQTTFFFLKLSEIVDVAEGEFLKRIDREA